MRAATIDRYGPPEVVQVVEVDDPTPRRGQVLVRVDAAAVSSGDARIRAARFPAGFAVPARVAFGIRRPRRSILGSALAGTVVAVGAEVERFAVGDRVAGMVGMAMGAHAELVAVDATRLVHVPAGVSSDDAAGVLFGGLTAWWYLTDRTSVGPGTTVLVNGASGAVGTNAVQLAAMLGATVTGVTSTRNVELVRALGATEVLDHTTVDVRAHDGRYDVVFDTVGNLSVADGRRLLRPGGTLLLAVAGLADTVLPRRDVRTGSSRERAADVATLLDLVADGKLRVVLDGCVDLDHVRDAHRLVDGGHKVGNVLVHP